MHLVHKISRLTDAHQGASRVDILHPAVHFLIRPECEVEEFVLRLQLDAKRLQVDALNVDDLLKRADESGRGGLLLVNAWTDADGEGGKAQSEERRTTHQFGLRIFFWER